MPVTEKEEGKTFAERVMPRIFKAAIMGVITFFLYCLLPMLMFSMIPTEGLPSEFSSFFSEYENLVYVFAAIMICFAVAIQLSSGTIFQHAFSIAKAIVLILYFIYALDGGILTLSIPTGEITISILADLTTFLAILILVNLLALAKSMFETINFLSQRAEQPPTDASKEEKIASIPELKLKNQVRSKLQCRSYPILYNASNATARNPETEP